MGAPTESINDIISHMREVCKKYDSIGAGHAAQPIHDWIRRLEAAQRNDEHYQWRQEICDRLGMGCEAGITWTTDQVYHHVMDLEEGAARYAVDKTKAIPGSDTLLKIGGKTFRCESYDCGANVFSKTLTAGYFRCNGCNEGYSTS